MWMKKRKTKTKKNFIDSTLGKFANKMQKKNDLNNNNYQNGDTLSIDRAAEKTEVNCDDTAAKS